jgi:hypothetical protein
VFLQDCQNVVDCGAVAGQTRRRSDQYIIHVYEDLRTKEMVLVDRSLEDTVHHPLERGGGVGESEKHDVRHEDAKLCFEGSLVPIFPSNTDIVISLPYVEFREDAGVLYASDCRGNKRHWIKISLHQHVRLSIILYWPVRAILLLEVKEGRGDISLIRVRMFDVLPGQHVVKPPAEVSAFPRCSGVHFAVEGFWGSGFEVDGVVPGSCGRESARFFFTEDVCVLLILSGYCHRRSVLPCLGGKVGGYPSSVGTLLFELLENRQFVDVG